MSQSVAALILSSLGLGGLLGIVVKSLLDRSKLRFDKVFEYKESRYKAMLILMWVAAKDSDFEYQKLREYRPTLHTRGDLHRELELEYYNAMLYASDRVLEALKLFLSHTDLEHWIAAAKAMRGDLYK